ncbi:MAG: ATP synthase subunit a [Anaerolineales bacterium]|nr:ATP synthase subunit a [Anaerolineales bacterium]
MTDKQQKKGWWRWGVNRWFVLLFIILGGYAAGFYPPIQPHVQLPPEPLSGTLFKVAGQDFQFTNTMLAMLIADVILLLIGLGVYRAVKSGAMTLKGMSAAVEALLEGLYNLTENTAGKWAKFIFPWFATITLLVLVVNWMELFPGVDSIGILHHSEHGSPVQNLGFAETIVKPTDGAEAHGEGAPLFGLIPFVRVLSTDLNFTVALALIAVVMVQVAGFKAQGFGYLTKFWNTKTFFSKPIFGLIDFGVGLLELISEFSKVLSFAFRLFGNIFAGSVLLFVIGSLLGGGGLGFFQVGFLMLEFFVGLIQAIVFGMLTMTFMAQATQGHGHEEHAEATAEAHEI